MSRVLNPVSSRSAIALLAAVALAAPVAMAQEKKPVSPAPGLTTSPNGPAAQPKPIPAQPPKGGTGLNVSPTQDPNAHPGMQPSDPAQSPLEWDNMAFDFGNIADTEPVTHTFKFKNKLDKTVTILRAHGSCGCTVPDLPKKSFAPGEAGEMIVRFDPHGRKGQNPKAVTIEYSEPAGTPNTTVTITSNVQPLVTIDPIKMYAMDVDSKLGKQVDITISGRKPGFQVLGVDSSHPALDIKIGEKKEVPMDGETYTQYPVTVTVKPNSPIGEIQTELTIRTNEEKAASQSYFFFAEVVGDIKATPAKLALRATSPKTVFSNVVSLESRSNKPFKVLSVDVSGRDDMQLVADVEPSNANGKQTYTIKLNGVTPDVMGLVSGELVITTDNPENSTLKLPFTATIRGSANAPVSPATLKAVPVGN